MSTNIFLARNEGGAVEEMHGRSKRRPQAEPVDKSGHSDAGDLQQNASLCRNSCRVELIGPGQGLRHPDKNVSPNIDNSVLFPPFFGAPRRMGPARLLPTFFYSHDPLTLAGLFPLRSSGNLRSSNLAAEVMP